MRPSNLTPLSKSLILKNFMPPTYDWKLFFGLLFSSRITQTSVGAELVNDDFVEPKNEEPLGTMSFESGDIEVIAE